MAHAAVEITWVEEGEARYKVGSREETVRPGDVIVVPAGVEHATTFFSPFRAGALWLSREMVAEIADAMGPHHRGGLEWGLARESSSIVPLARALGAEVQRAAAGHLLAADALAEAITVEMLRRAPRRDTLGMARDPRVLAALDFVREHYADPIGVREMAKAAGMSRFHFSRLFCDEVGDAPYRHLLRTRIARAAELLRRRRHSVTEVAFAVGFCDLGRFSKMFRREMGVRPGEMTDRVQ